MKKIFYSSVAFLLLLVAGGCKKFLTQTPQTAVATEEFFKSLKDINSAMAGIYSSWQTEMTGDGTGFTGQYFAWGEMRSDNFDDNGQYASSSYKQLAQNTLTSGNTAANWTGIYRTIGRCNTAIKYIPQAAQYDANATPPIVNASLAQCYAMRALCYFYILRIWGDAVVWLEPYTDVSKPDQRPRSPKDSVMNNVILPDLDKAYTLMPKGQTPIVWNIGEGAIAAIAADVMMWKKDYPAAISWINKVFTAKNASGKVFAGTAVTDLEPTATWKNNFLSPGSSRESIWSVHWDNTYNGCACQAVTYGASNNYAHFDSTIQNDWKKVKADIRVAQTIDTFAGLGHNDKLLKYFPMNGQFNSGGLQALSYNVYLVMYRLADVYLSYAEALNKTNDAANALKYLNFVRTRAGLTAYAANDPAVATQADMENAILTERRYELYGEGKRWFDLVRTGKVKDVMDPILMQRQRRLGTPQTGFGSDLNKIMFPLYRTLLEDNKLLKQNDSYN